MEGHEKPGLIRGLTMSNCVQLMRARRQLNLLEQHIVRNGQKEEYDQLLVTLVRGQETIETLVKLMEGCLNHPTSSETQVHDDVRRLTYDEARAKV